VDVLRLISYILVVIGAINWGLVGLFRFDLINTIFVGDTIYHPSVLTRIVYILVGLAGVYLLTLYSKLMSSEDE